MKLRKSKKSMIFSPALVIITFAVLITTFIAVYQRESMISETPIGERSYNIILAHQKLENAIFYLQQSGKLIIEESMSKLAEQGGFQEPSPCGKHGTTNLWHNKTDYCHPPYLENLGKIFSSKITPSIQIYPEKITFPTKYEFTLKNPTTATAIPKTHMKITINTTEEESGEYYLNPSFQLTLPQELNYPELFQQAKEFINLCNDKPLSCISTNIPTGWDVSAASFLPYIGSGPTIISSEELKETRFEVLQNDIETVFALYIDSDIPSSGDPQTQELSQGNLLTFQDKNDDSHTLTIDSITQDGVVTITITSDPITFDIHLGEEKILDITGDSTYDIYIKLNEITPENKANITLTIFEKPQEDADIVQSYLSGEQWDTTLSAPPTSYGPYYTQDKLCARPGSYRHDFDANILLEWAQETGYNPCYVAAFVQGECSWKIDTVTGGYYGMFQWGAASLTDMKSGDWGRYPLANALTSHTEIINLGLADQLDLLKEYFTFRGVTPEDNLAKMYQSVAFPWCMSHSEDGEYNLDHKHPGTSGNNTLWRYPEGPPYATCRGIAYYAHIKAFADPSLSFCSCECQSGQTSCPTDWYEEQLGEYVESQTQPSNQYTTQLYNWPVDLLIVNSCYGHRPYLSYADNFHGGNDIPTPIGTNVYPMAEGTVYRICDASCSGFGNAVIIKHDDSFFTGYNHLSVVLVTVGQEVTTNTIIAKTGDTGAGGAHLDIKVYTSEGDILGKDTGKNVLCFLPEGITNQLTFTGTNCQAGEPALDSDNKETGYIYPDPKEKTVCSCSDVGTYCSLA